LCIFFSCVRGFYPDFRIPPTVLARGGVDDGAEAERHAGARQRGLPDADAGGAAGAVIAVGEATRSHRPDLLRTYDARAIDGVVIMGYKTRGAVGYASCWKFGQNINVFRLKFISNLKNYKL
jgi:hypothetical protein